MIIRILAAVGLLTTSAAAHELTPTYPKLRPSFMEGVYVTEMHMWNRRSDVKYYGVGVFDKDMEAIPFATSTKILRLEHLAQSPNPLSKGAYIQPLDVDSVARLFFFAWGLLPSVIMPFLIERQSYYTNASAIDETNANTFCKNNDL